MDCLFYFIVLLCGYSYFLYPLALMLVPARSSLSAAVIGDNNLPQLSLIIAAHNEAGRIHTKLKNTLNIDYPKDCLEIIAASDFSINDTDVIVESYADKGIRLVRADEHKGKEYAQLCAIRESRGEILVFSDVATEIPAEALRRLAARFSDPHIGALSSEDRFISNDGRVVAEGAHVKYEIWLRRLESGQAGPTASLRQNILVRIIFFFVQTNLVLAQATLMFLSGRRMTVWTPSQR